jgi:hypothetical protein
MRLAKAQDQGLANANALMDLQETERCVRPSTRANLHQRAGAVNLQHVHTSSPAYLTARAMIFSLGMANLALKSTPVLLITVVALKTLYAPEATGLVP